MTGLVSRAHANAGVALITVLLVVVIATVLGVSTAKKQHMTIQSSSHFFTRAQARYFALGGEEFARQILHKDFVTQPQWDSLDEPWAEPNMFFEFDGGDINLNIIDLQGRLNVNGLIGKGQKIIQSRARISLLTNQLGADPAWMDKLVDWSDLDTAASPLGAEDYDYLGLSPAYRTSSQPLADLSELRLLLGFSNEAFFSLKDHLAVLPDAYSDLNVNTCSGLVLQTLATGLSLEQADSILATRITEGAFASVEAFLQQPELAGLGVNQEGLSVQSRFFEVKVRARFEDQIAYLTSILHRDPVTGAIVVVGRNSGEKFIMGTGIRQPVENSDG